MQDVHKADYLVCSVSTSIPGFSNPNKDGNWSRLDVGSRHVPVAAATLGSADKARHVPLTPGDRFHTLESGKIDVLSRVTTIEGVCSRLGKNRTLSLKVSG